jgi:hypothetical protein
MISPSFTIRAKKPIIRPGMKKRKGEEDEDEILPVKQVKLDKEVLETSSNFDFETSLFDPHSWEIVEPPVDECFEFYNVMNIEDKKKLLEKILEVASFSERELLVSKLIRVGQITTRDKYDDQIVDKYFTDFGDLNL